MENFAAFFSYVHADDEHDNGRLTKLRKMIENEVQAITGESFEVFQDLEDLHWGQRWEERLHNTLDGTTFLIVAVTPRYLRREACRKEMERFLERERQLGREDLILPVLYIETPALSNKELQDADSLAQAIASRQWFDWRDLRHEPHTNPDVGKRLTKMAQEIEKAMRRGAAPASKPARKAEAASPVAAPTILEIESKTSKISPRNEPPTLVVDPMPGRGDHTRIMDAVEAAEPGARILIRPGLYKEALVLEKALELIGDGERSDIIIETYGAHALLFKTEFGRVANLTLRQTGGSDFYGVDIAQGHLELEDCDIASQSSTCIAIHDGADPHLRRNSIHNGKKGGVFIYRNGEGTLEDNDIFANTLAGVVIQTGGDPTLRHNRIHDGNQIGVLVCSNGKGTLEDNDVFANALTGLEVRENSTPIVRRNRITKNIQYGIYLHNSGGGTFENNDLRGNRQPWRIDDDDDEPRAYVKRSGNIEK